MRKVLLALTLTAVGLALLLSFKSRSGSTVSALGASAIQNNTNSNSNSATNANPDSSTAPSTAPSSNSSGSSNSSTKSSTSSSAGSGSGSGSTAKTSVAGTFTGTSIDTRYGPVEVQAVVAGGKLTNVNVLEVPDNGGYEDQIVAVALPQLKSEALAAQSGNIDIVSGATYTSEGYARSLQAALDKAGM